MNLKRVCESHGLDYGRAWYALATGRVPGAKVVGREWQLGPKQIELLRLHLAHRVGCEDRGKADLPRT